MVITYNVFSSHPNGVQNPECIPMNATFPSNIHRYITHGYSESGAIYSGVRSSRHSLNTNVLQQWTVSNN
jgi:hypothetical protein